jgi:hypothetical protein
VVRYAPRWAGVHRGPAPVVVPAMSTLRAMVICAGILGMGAGSAGCAGYIHASGGAAVTGPTLVALGPGIWVVENHREAVFYSDGHYWRWHNGVWYRSSSWSTGWVVVRVDVLPVMVRRIDRPVHYVYYKAPPGAEVRKGPPPSGHAAKPHGTPPGHGGTPPGHGGTPPGHGGTPPGHGGTPPGHAGPPPGHGGTPPGHAVAGPPGHGHKEPPGQAKKSDDSGKGHGHGHGHGQNKKNK